MNLSEYKDIIKQAIANEVEARKFYEDAAVRTAVTKHGRQLQDNDYDADTAHETGYHGVGHHGDVFAELESAKNKLENPGHHDDGKGDRQTFFCGGSTGSEMGNHSGHNHRHRPRGFRNEGRGSPKEGRKKAHKHSTPETGFGPSTRRYPES